MILDMTVSKNTDGASRLRRFQKFDHTCWIEILPGPYNHKCWNANSVYLDEDDFCTLVLEPLRQSFKSFDLYAFQDVPAEFWHPALENLALKCAQDDVAPWMWATERDLSQWVLSTLETHDVIAVLGM